MPDPTHPILAETAQTVAAKARAPQIRPRLQEACRAIVSEGLSVPDAAKRCGMSVPSLQIDLRKPHVRAFVSHVRDAWLNSRTAKAWLNIADLADRACSEDVRLKANRTFLEAAGELGNKGQDGSAIASTLVQIVINAAKSAGQLTDGQSSGVIEAQPWRAIEHDTSNSHTVGRGDDDDA